MSITRMRYGMRSFIRPFIWIFLAIFIISSVFMFGFGSNQQNGANAARNAAFMRVNGKEVSREFFDTYMQQMAQQQRNMGFGGGVAFEYLMSTIAFDRALQESLKRQAAEKMGIDVSEREAEDQIETEVEQIVKMRAPTLKGEDLENFKSQVRAMFSVEARRTALMGQKLEEKIRAAARPVEVRVQHILIKTDSRSAADALKKAQEVHAKAKAGQDFGQLVTQFSEDEGSKPKAGDVDWVNDKAGLVPEFKAAALKLKKGEISEPVQTQFGYHILKATDERPYVSTEKDPKKKQEDETQYKDRVAGAIWEGYVEGLRRQAKLEGVSAFAKGLLLEREAQPEGQAQMGAMSPPLTPQDRGKLLAAAKAFTEALNSPGAEAGNGLRWHIAELYTKIGDATPTATDADKKSRADAYEQAVAMLKTALGKGGDKEIYMQLGELYQKTERKTDAVQAYIDASKVAYDDIAVRGQLADKFKELGRMDLSKEQAAEKQRREQQQAAERKRQEAEQKKMEAEAKKREAEEKKKQAAEKKKAAPAADDKSKQPAAKDTPPARP